MILVIAAMDEEVNALLETMERVTMDTIHEIVMYRGVISDKEICLAKSGVGKINAAIVTTTLLSALNPKFVINIGSAGGLLQSQTVGDIVIATKVLSHDFDIGPNTAIDSRFQYLVNTDVFETVRLCVESLSKKYYSGLIVSGDQFVVNGSYAYNRIVDIYPDAICAEMEATAVGAACTRYNVPFAIVRALSDVPFYKDNEKTFEDYLELASKESAEVCVTLIKKVRI